MGHSDDRHPDLTLHAGPAWLWAVLFAVGIVGWAIALAVDADAGYRAILVNFMFFTPLAVGLVAWPAVVRLARGKWMGPIEQTAVRGIAFGPFSLLAFIGLFIGREHWAVWMHEHIGDKAAWLNVPFLFIRDAAGLIVLWAVAAWFFWRTTRASRDRSAEPPAPLAAVFVVLYCVVFTLLGFDLVMALSPHWFSSLFGGYIFISGMYAAVAAWTVLVLLSQPVVQGERRHDLAKLVIAFSMLTAYFMYSQLNVIWYENLPEETKFVIPRLNEAGSPWRWVSLILLATVYLGPLVMLLTRWAKDSQWYLASVCGLILASLWLERWWLIAPSLEADVVPGLAEFALLLAFVAAFMLCVIMIGRALPADGRRPAEGGSS